jgi:hypothetical protein
MESAGPTVLTRQQLYEMIWKEPTRTVAPRLGISDVGLAKVCRKFHIPRPWRGYWREKETGHKPRQAKLPAWPAHLGPEPEAITFRAVPPPGKTPPPRPPEPETVQRQRAYEAVPEHGITVAETLTEPDRMVRRAVRLLRKKSEPGYLIPGEYPCLDIRATAGSLDRALRIFEALLTGFRSRGWAVECQPESPCHTRVTVLDEVIAVGITEKVRTIRAPREPIETRDWLKPQPKDTYEPTGQLTLWLGTDATHHGQARTWSDGKRQRLENCLNGVMIGFVQVAEDRKAARREAEEQRRRWAEEERQRQLAVERREREKDRREELKREVEVWSWAREVRAYVAALEGAASEHLVREPDGRTARWIRWAHRYADRIDPLREVEALPRDPDGYGRTPLDLEGFALSASKS